jgi:succinate dehydrogenase / fumarate reductase, membrane anchor subunit
VRGGNPLGRVLGLGSAKDGAHHWWVQRVSSVALVPLSLWLAWALLSLPGFDHASVVAWIQGPVTAVLLSLFVVVGVWHSQLGVQVVIEDYVHGHGLKVASLLVVSFLHVLAGALGVFAVLRIAFGAA